MIYTVLLDRPGVGHFICILRVSDVGVLEEVKDVPRGRLGV